MTNPPTLLILAAGMGSRYGGLKQLEAVGPNGETLLDFSVFDAIRAGFGRIVFVIRRDLEDAFRDVVGSRYDKRIPIDYAFQELDDLPEGFSVPSDRQKPWGTGQAILAARSVVKGPFAAINADDFYGRESFSQLVAYFDSCRRERKTPHCLVAYRLQQTLSESGEVNRGICEVSGGRLVSVAEFEEIRREASGKVLGSRTHGQTQELDPEAPVSMNCWGFDVSIFHPLAEAFKRFLDRNGGSLKSEFYLPAFVDEQIHTGAMPCEVLSTSSSWFGVTYPGDRDQVRARLVELTREGVYPTPLMP